MVIADSQKNVIPPKRLVVMPPIRRRQGPAYNTRAAGVPLTGEVIDDVDHPEPLCTAAADIADKRKRFGGTAFEKLQDVDSEESSGSSYVPQSHTESSSDSSVAPPT